MKISIITATYNSSGTIRDTIESVLKQNFEDYEHIIIDGGSTDNTLDIIKEYEPLYKGRLKYISEPDKGIYDAMNKGIDLASGEIIGILNSDDFFTSANILSDIACNIGNNDAVYGDVHYVDAENIEKSVRYFSSASFKQKKMRWGYMPAHPSFYCRRELFNKFGKFDESLKVVADFELLLRLIYFNNINIKYLPLDFVTMRAGGASSSGFSSYKTMIKERLKIYHKYDIKGGIWIEFTRYVHRLFEIIAFRINKYKYLNKNSNE